MSKASKLLEYFLPGEGAEQNPGGANDQIASLEYQLRNYKCPYCGFTKNNQMNPVQPRQTRQVPGLNGDHANA